MFALNVFDVAELFRRLLVPFLLVTGTALAALLLYLALLRVVRELTFRRRRRVGARYRPDVDALLQPAPPAGTIDRLRRCPRRHRRIVGDLLIAPLRVATGDLVAHLGAAANAVGLLETWRGDLGDRRWWVRAEGARSLGLIRHAPAFAALVAALDDAHEEVRAAAVGALGMLHDRRAIPELISRLADESRHQRVRLIEALRVFGAPVTPALTAYAGQHAESVVAIADVLGLIGSTAAVDSLIRWCGDQRPQVRAASLRALGTIGLDDRSFYYALRAIGDADADVRSVAARALGRSGRPDAAPYLDAHMADAWEVAAECATGLQRLGDAGLARLQARVDDEGQAGDLARQILWERAAATAAPPSA